MKRLKTLRLVLVLMVLSANAHGQSMTGMYLKQMCAKGEPTGPFTADQSTITAYAHSEWCYGYISGFFAFSSGPAVPDGVTAEQVRLVLIRYLDAHPEILHSSADDVLRKAVYDAWRGVK